MPPPRGRPSREQKRLKEIETLHSKAYDLKALHTDIRLLRTELAEQTHQVKKLHNRMLLLQTSTVKTLTFLFQLLDDPDAKAHAAAVVADFKHNAS